MMPCDDKTGSCAAEQAEGKAADWANAECMCVTLDRQRLAALLDAELGVNGAGDTLLASQSTLFADGSSYQLTLPAYAQRQ